MAKLTDNPNNGRRKPKVWAHKPRLSTKMPAGYVAIPGSRVIIEAANAATPQVGFRGQSKLRKG